jgi:hypothetical protein
LNTVAALVLLVVAVWEDMSLTPHAV